MNTSNKENQFYDGKSAAPINFIWQPHACTAIPFTWQLTSSTWASPATAHTPSTPALQPPPGSTWPHHSFGPARWPPSNEAGSSNGLAAFHYICHPSTCPTENTRAVKTCASTIDCPPTFTDPKGKGHSVILSSRKIEIQLGSLWLLCYALLCCLFFHISCADLPALEYFIHIPHALQFAAPPPPRARHAQASPSGACINGVPSWFSPLDR